MTTIVVMPCFAETSIPASVDPGAINAQIKIKPENNYTTTNKEFIDTSKVTPQESPAIHYSKKFLLKGIEYSGHTIFTTKELEKISSELINKEITFEDLDNVAKTITKLYKKNGYLTSKAYIPPQVMQDGILKISILEGTIGDIEIKGEKWVKAQYLKNNLLKTNQIEEKKIFNVNNLGESLSLVNTPKYLKGKVDLQRGDKTGETDIILEVEDRFPLSVIANWNNTGRELVGVQRGAISTSIENLTGYGDRLWANNTFAQRTYGFDTGYKIPLNAKGTSFSLGYSMSNSELGGAFKSQQIEGESKNFSTSITHPLYKKNNWTVDSRITFDAINSDTTILKTTSLNKYKVRALRGAISTKKEDFQGRWIGDLMLSAGLPIFNASENELRGFPDSKFFKLNPSLIRVQILPKKCIGIIKASAQFSSDTLLPAEQMQLGGGQTIRGFDEGVLLGDTGYSLSFEARSPVPYAPQIIKLKYWKNKELKIPFKDTVKLAVFYDQGWTKTIKQGKSATYLNFLQSIGTGLRINIQRYLSANFDVGVPLGKERSSEQKTMKFHFSINADLI